MNSIPQQHLNAQIALEAAQWFVTNREGALAPEQARAFMQWLQQSPQHVAEYLQVTAIAELAPAAAKHDPVAYEDLLAHGETDNNVVALHAVETAAASADAAAELNERHTWHARSRRTRLIWWTGIAASLLLAVVGGLLSWSMYRADLRNYATAHGEQGDWRLPDGSRLRLNAESAVTIRFDRSKRQVDVVHGQALFDVAQQPARPFEVRAGSHVIEDIGTVFDVYRHSGETTVTVVEGRVHVWDMPHARSQRTGTTHAPVADLRAGQRARIFSSGTIALSRVDTHNAVAWTREEIVFDDEPLAVVVAEFNRYSRVQVRIGDERIGELAVSGAFSIRDEATFRAFLDSLPGVRAEATVDDVILRHRSVDRN